MHDVLVAGGSIAGAATAIHLARRGRHVLLIERAQELRPKACGEGVLPAGVAALAALGLSPETLTPSATLRSVRFCAGGRVAEAPFSVRGRAGLGVRRDLLDPSLLERARAEGVDVRTGVTARRLLVESGKVAAIETTGGPLPARAFVAADGLHSRLRRLAGLDARAVGDRYGISAHLRLPAPPDEAVQVHFRSGYELYLTPVGGDCANVAILLRRPAMRDIAGDPGAAFDRAIAREPLLARAERIDGPHVAGPFPRQARRAWRGNLVLAGDAAGFFDGITGEGMSAALVGARMCAAAIDAYLRNDSCAPLRVYDTRRRAFARNSTLFARMALLLARSPAVAAHVVGNLSRRPATFARLVAVSNGEVGLLSLSPRDVVAMLTGR
ncbi:MAG: NAD(P)/FAD-dependent oxidoreductase [Chloroflexi bacterium]|nr:NAD(P)/FAD-dependent oxidoreductase [Chloroflexota bacterium]